MIQYRTMPSERDWIVTTAIWWIKPDHPRREAVRIEIGFVRMEYALQNVEWIVACKDAISDSIAENLLNSFGEIRSYECGDCGLTRRVFADTQDPKDLVSGVSGVKVSRCV